MMIDPYRFHNIRELEKLKKVIKNLSNFLDIDEESLIKEFENFSLFKIPFTEDIFSYLKNDMTFNLATKQILTSNYN